MGDILVSMYDIITKKAGLEGRLKFAELIGISKKMASEINDSPASVEKWKEAASAIIGEDISSYL